MHYRFYSPYMRLVDVLGVRAAKFPPKTPPKKVWAENAARRKYSRHAEFGLRPCRIPQGACVAGPQCGQSGGPCLRKRESGFSRLSRPLPASPFCNFATLRINWD